MSLKTTRRRYAGQYSWNRVIILPDGSRSEVTTPGLASNETWNDTINGGSYPGWRRAIELGNNATTGLTAYRRRIHQSGALGQATLVGIDKSKTYFTVIGNILPIPPETDPSGQSTSEAYKAAVISFRQQVRNKQQAFQGGVFVAELAKAVHMIRQPVSAMRNLVDVYLGKAKKLRRTHHSSRSRAYTDAYLEFTYGWNPLHRDAQDAAKALERVLHGRPEIQKITAYGRGPENASIGSQSITHGGILKWGFVYKTLLFGDVQLKGAVRVGVPDLMTDCFQQFGIDGTTSFLPTLWELLPWSFVIDYFSNVGNLIEAVSTADFTVIWGSNATKKRYVRTGFATPAPLAQQPSSPESYQRLSGNQPSYNDTIEYLTRGPFGMDQLDLSILDLSFKVPGIESPKKWLNMAALLRARYS